MEKNNGEPSSTHLLELSLIHAVPMWMNEHKNKPYDWLDRRRSICAQKIAEKGDVIMYGSKTKGNAGDAFNFLAEGIAILLLIIKNPAPFGSLVFMPDGTTKRFDSDKDANDFVFGSRHENVP